MQRRDGNDRLISSVTVFPKRTAYRISSNVRQMSLHENYIQYLNIIAIKRLNQNQKYVPCVFSPFPDIPGSSSRRPQGPAATSTPPNKNQAKRRRAIMLFADSAHFRLPFIGFRAIPFQTLQKAQKTPLKAHKSPFIPRTPRRGSPFTRERRTSRKNNAAPSRFPCFSSPGAGVHARRSTYPAGKLCGRLPARHLPPLFHTAQKREGRTFPFWQTKHPRCQRRSGRG